MDGLWQRTDPLRRNRKGGSVPLGWEMPPGGKWTRGMSSWRWRRGKGIPGRRKSLGKGAEAGNCRMLLGNSKEPRVVYGVGSVGVSKRL